MRKSMVLCFTLVGILLAGPISAADVQQKVSRLPPLPQPLDPILKQMFDKRDAMGGAVINLSLVRGHAPKIAKTAEATAFAMRFDATTPRNLRELAIYRTAEIVGSEYEINQHTPLMKMCGYSSEQIAEVALGRPLNAFDRSVDVHVSRLRKKLGSFLGTEELIRPIRGVGYFLAATAVPEKAKA